MSRPRSDHPARRAALADAAAAIMASQGGEHVSMRTIAAALGVTTGVLTHYFPSKQALLKLTKERAFDRAYDRAHAAAGLAHGRERILAVVGALLPLDVERRLLWRLLAGYLADAAATSALRQAQARRMRKWWTLHATLVAEAQRADEVDPALDPEATGLAIATFVEGLALQAVTTTLPPLPGGLDAFARTHVDRLLGPRPAERRRRGLSGRAARADRETGPAAPR
jgi:AcrR family transcriptional regulator